ncbi:MAG TPA: HAD family hydrolase [Verrucomicrobiota bacterium]|nr:HAD family hydrolase [Verrucomicrobiota bacterium]HNT13793.1 HAD family hydrolase [Verrucomicrobiota bacterium]
MIKLVLFDIDGTLVHTGGAGVKAFAKTFATEFGLTQGLEHMRFAGGTDTALVRKFFHLNGITPAAEHFTRFFEHYVFWLDHLLPQSETATCPGVWELIRALQALPDAPTLGLLTGNIQLGAEIKLRHFNLWSEFVLGAFADDHEERDDIARAAHRRGAQFLGRPLRGAEVLVIGDTPLDIKCGRAIGAHVLAVATGGATREALEQHQPDWLISDLRELSAREICRHRR